MPRERHQKDTLPDVRHDAADPRRADAHPADPRVVDRHVRPRHAGDHPFFAFALGAGIDIKDIATGGFAGLFIGVGVVLFTGGLLYLAYRFILKRGPKSGIGFAAGTTAGNAVATPAIVVAADASFQPYLDSAIAQVAAAVLVTALLAPTVAAFVLRREGGLQPSTPRELVEEGVA